MIDPIAMTFKSIKRHQHPNVYEVITENDVSVHSNVNDTFLIIRDNRVIVFDKWSFEATFKQCDVYNFNKVDCKRAFTLFGGYEYKIDISILSTPAVIIRKSNQYDLGIYLQNIVLIRNKQDDNVTIKQIGEV